MTKEHSSDLAIYSTSRRSFLKAGAATALAATGVSSFAFAEADRPLIYGAVNWSDGMAITHVGKQLIEKHLGYKVELLEADVAVVYASLGSGKADVFSSTYLEGESALAGDYKGGHVEYVNKIKDQIEIVGISEGPMAQGFAVPEYVTIDSIEELNANAEKFGGQIVGIDAGSGLMQSADQAVKDYGVKLKLVAGSQAAMQAAFQRAYERQEWVVVTTWDPLPMWAQFKMKYLGDPKKAMMSEPYYCFHGVRNDLKTNFPKAYSFFQKYHNSNADLAAIMGSVDGGMKPEEAAAKWIKENEGKGIIEKWIA